jgi:hypothetical protein
VHSTAETGYYEESVDAHEEPKESLQPARTTSAAIQWGDETSNGSHAGQINDGTRESPYDDENDVQFKEGLIHSVIDYARGARLHRREHSNRDTVRAVMALVHEKAKEK